MRLRNACHGSHISGGRPKVQLKSSRNRGPLWRKLLVALMTVALAVPFISGVADASSADRLTVRINSPKAGDTVSGFVNVAMTCNPQGQLGVPAKRQDTPYRTFALQYSAGDNPG